MRKGGQQHSLFFVLQVAPLAATVANALVADIFLLDLLLFLLYRVKAWMFVHSRFRDSGASLVRQAEAMQASIASGTVQMSSISPPNN